MIDSLYSSIFKQGLFGYALHEIILDSKGDPFDYIFLEANEPFGNLTGLNVDSIIGKTVRTVLPGIENSEFDWISYYGNVALKGGSESFEQYNEQLERWYLVEVLTPAKNQFVTIFIDVTDQHILSDASIEFNKYTYLDTNFEKIAADMRDLSGAMFVVLNKFDMDGRDYVSVGLSGLGNLIKSYSKALGFKISGRRWKYDPIREAKIKNQKTTTFECLEDLVGKVLPGGLISKVAKAFKIGQVAVIKTSQDDRMVGDFTLIFEKGQTIKNQALVESYADIVGMLLGRINAEEALTLSEKKFKAIASHTPDHIIVQDKDLRYLLVVNPIVGSTEQDMLGKTDLELDRSGNVKKLLQTRRRC